MIRSALIVVLGLLLSIPAVQAGETAEYVHCYSGSWTPMHDSKDLPGLWTYELEGIVMSKSDNKFLDNASTHCRGMGIVRPGSKPQVISYCVAIDPDGDMLIWGGPRQQGGAHERPYGQGTGKYKGIKGSHKSEHLAEAKKHVKSRTMQGCRTMKGTFELPPK